MKSSIISCLSGLLLFTGGCGPSGSGNSSNQDSGELPNIVYIISDDQAWTDYGFMGHPHIQTPHLDLLASQGRTFTRGYSVAPLCSPSLATLITGVYPQQHGITGNDPAFSFEGKRYSKEWMVERRKHYTPYLERFGQYPTVPDLLKEKGYASFQSGKWWGGSWQDGGFTGGMTHGNPENGGRHGDEGLRIGREGMQPVFDFIDQAAGQHQPFFLWYAPFLPHAPHTPPDSLLDKYLSKAPSRTIAQYWAMCEWFDITIGQLLQKLEEEGLTENTLIVYACDNGWIQDPEKANAYMPGSKQDPNEMGIRTPLIFKWPKRIKPGLDTTTLVSTIDIVPTVLSAASMAPSPEMPGSGFGYFTQEVDDLDPQRRVIEEVTAIAEFIILSDGSQVSASRFLEMFLFPREKQYTYVGRLSGGERKRLQLLKVLVKHPNFLILDEPTNDFDIGALNVLEDFLEKFKGCLILVSHDRYFMDHLVDQLFVFEGNGAISIFNGNYSAYRAEQEEIQESLRQQEIKQAAIKKQAGVSASQPVKPATGLSKKKMSYKEKREYEALQPAVDLLETEKKELITRMETGNMNYEELQKCAERVEELTVEIDEKTFRWLELDELIK